jgi:HK97 family phage major capsid protein
VAKLTMAEVRAAQEERQKLFKDAEKIVKTSRDEKRDMTAEETAEFDRLHDRAADLTAAVQASRETEEREERSRKALESLGESRGRATRPADLDAGKADGLAIKYAGKNVKIKAGSSMAKRASAEYQGAFSDYLITGLPSAGLQTDSGPDGGYMAPPQFVAELVAELSNSFWLRGLSNVMATTAPRITMPRRTARMAKFAWASELATPTADTSLKLGTYSLNPHYVTGEIEVSNDLIRAGAFDVDAFVRAEIAFRAGELEEEAFLTGNGVDKPLGLFTASADGINTDRDTTADQTTYEAWADTKMSLTEPYLRSPNLRWVMHRNAVRALMKIKESSGAPLWMVNTRDNNPDTLLGIPVVLSEYAPAGTGANVYQSGNYVAILGDFRNYDIVDGLDVSINVYTDSAYGRRNCVGYVVRRKVDAAPRVSAAFSRLKKT